MKQEPDVNAEEFPLSPSERMGIDIAQNLSGGKKRAALSTRATLAAIVLGFEIVIIFLASLTFFGLRVFQPAEVGLLIGGVLILATIIALAFLRRPVGILLGWLVQCLLAASAFFLPAMLIVALFFGGCYSFAIIKGGQIDRARKEYAGTHP